MRRFVIDESISLLRYGLNVSNIDLSKANESPAGGNYLKIYFFAFRVVVGIRSME